MLIKKITDKTVKKEKYYQDQIRINAAKQKWLALCVMWMIGILRFESTAAFFIGLTVPLGWKSHFNFYGLNPKTITEEQSKKHPILLFHGLLHNQGVWLYLAKALKDANLGPLFTINLPKMLSINGPAHSLDRVQTIGRIWDEVQEKIKSIRALYRPWTHDQPVTVNVVGYSAGASVASSLLEAPSVNIRIYVGATERRGESEYEILGERDVLDPPPVEGDQIIQAERRVYVDCGHLSLVRSPVFFKKLTEILSQHNDMNHEKIAPAQNPVQKPSPSPQGFFTEAVSEEKIVRERKRACCTIL